MFWPAPTWRDVWHNLVFAEFRVNGPTWSIWPELVGSAFIPAVFVIHARFCKALQWLVGGLVLAAMVVSPYCRYLIYFYAGFFAVPQLVPFVADRRWLRTAILLLGIGMLASFGNGTSNYSLKTIVPPAFGATLLIVAIASTRYRVLESGPLRFLGRISYSFYLLHWPIFYLCAIAVLACPSVVPVGFGGNLAIMITSIAVTIVAADISYRLIERPFMDAGRSLVHRVIEPRAAG
jgi:peptidoglycan/LPS O-acetylase OafA/YrhL